MNHYVNEYLDQEALHVAMARQRIKSGNELGKRAGLSMSYGRMVTYGLLPTVETRRKIAAVLQLQPEDLWKPVPQGVGG